ncbi:recombinase family protein [Candidatus Sumerlaeota bacterium]
MKRSQTIRKGDLAHSYLRLSGMGQLQGDGFDRQRETIGRFAKAYGVEIVQEFRDEGVSGTKDSVDRPALTELLEEIESNGVRIVLVEHADRLARDLIIQEMLVQEFERLGVKVIACESGTDLAVGDSDPTKKLVRQILGAISEFEKSRLVSKLRVARERKRKRTGRCEGRLPFGLLPGEAETLNRMKQLNRKPRMGKRRSMAEIARKLNEEGRPTRTGIPWGRQSVRTILCRAK